MFELTDTLTYVGPVTLAILVAKTVADALEPKGIYDLVIEYVIISRLLYWRASVPYRTILFQAISTPIPG